MTRGLRRSASVLGVLLSLLLTMAGCGMQATTTTTTPAAVTVTLGNGPAAVGVGQTFQYSAAVANATNTAVTWAVNGVAGGNSTVGTISSSGLYTVPALVPTPASVTVTATSQADPAKSASTTVTIAGVAVAVSITSPASPASVAVGASLGIAAAVTGTGNSALTWAVDGVTNGNSAAGTITGGTAATATYNAPTAIPATNPVTVTATSQADNAKSASLMITITPGSGGNATPITVAGNLSKTTEINFSLTSVTPTLYITQIGTCSGTPLSCSFSVAPIEAPSAGSTTTVILLGHGLTSGGTNPTLNSNLQVRVSMGNTMDATVSGVTAYPDYSGSNVIVFSVQVSAGAVQGPRAIIVKDTGTGEQQTFLGGFIIGP